MELDYKTDLPRVLERFEAWWKGELIDRPLVSFLSYEESEPAVTGADQKFPTLRQRWMDPAHAVNCFETSLAKANFPAETLPVFIPNLGPSLVSTAFGAELAFAENTSWNKPVVDSCREILRLKPNLDNVYWNTIREMTDMSLQRGKGKWLTGLPDLHTNGDLLASLRGTEQLCLDLATDIDSVRKACEHVTEAYPLLYDDLYSRIAATGQPTTTWLPFLHTGRAYATNCDFMCMISSKMFQEAFLPSLLKEIEYLDRNVFHLDGPGALKHLDTMLALEQLDALQWVFGDGNGPSQKWIEVYRKGQAAGKALQIFADSPEEARRIADHIQPNGVWFIISKACSQGEVKSLTKWLEGWAAEKR